MTFGRVRYKNLKINFEFVKNSLLPLINSCSKIGGDLLRQGGSSVDAMIGTLLCEGVVNGYHSGIGGATFFNVYDK